MSPLAEFKNSILSLAAYLYTFLLLLAFLSTGHGFFVDLFENHCMFPANVSSQVVQLPRCLPNAAHSMLPSW